MRESFDLSESCWMLTGTAPHSWQLGVSMEVGVKLNADIEAIPVKVPGSVQLALRDAGLLPDWNIGLNGRQCEWVENRQWIYSVKLPEKPEAGCRYVLCCKGLDHAGAILVNGQQAANFESAFVPYEFNITEFLNPGVENELQILFDLSPRYQGQFGRTADYTAQKPRFYYTWDWMPRMVQIGIWDSVTLEKRNGALLKSVAACADGESVTVRGAVDGSAGMLRIILKDDDQIVVKKEIPVSGEFSEALNGLDVEKWWPNGMGDQKLYRLTCELLDHGSQVQDRWSKNIGFREIDWLPCEDAPENADPWICSVNGDPVFLQGVNWTPILPNFADVKPEQYRTLIDLYRQMGCNFLRIWGGAALERELFYDLCDEAGLMLWQEFPLSSSGTESVPPNDEYSMNMLADAARSYIDRLQHHPSVVLWGGGNELNRSQTRSGMGGPCDLSEPLLQWFADLVEEFDPHRRFVATSPTGPSFNADEKNFGKGVHWDVHGPWKNPYDTFAEWEVYWEADDALLRSETGAAGASPAQLIQKYAGNVSPFPSAEDNPLWRRTSWWNDWTVFLKEFGREPESLEEFTEWSADYQARQLQVAARCCKERFPKCGGVVVWMGHDSFPCTANTSVIDFEQNPKPAFFALREVFLSYCRKPAEPVC